MALTREKENKFNKKYDDRECWDLAMSWGAAFTVDKLHRWHKKNKGFGSRMGGVWAMWRWAARNPELCYPQFKKWYFENAIGETRWEEIGDKMVEKDINPNVTFEEFLEKIRDHAKDKDSVLSNTAYKTWCAKWNMEE